MFSIKYRVVIKGTTMRISIVSFLIMVSSSVFAQDFAKGAAAYAEQEFAKGL